MVDDNDIERLEQRLEKNKAKGGKLMIWLAFSALIYWLAIFRLTWSEVDAMVEKATLGIQEVNVGIISIVLVSITSASVAATLMNAPIYMIVRQLSRDIEADKIALRQARMVRDTMLLRNTTDLDKPEIEGLVKNPEAELQNEAEKKSQEVAETAFMVFLVQEEKAQSAAAYAPLALTPIHTPIKKAEPKPCFFLLPRWRIG